ncbi:MAG: ascorbate-dependent monooxygenase [Alphaproteobacteria bacterium]|nr:MAG: ascorbate-dependent monooxygenase [Alphaproteobacteria bacterium]
MAPFTLQSYADAKKRADQIAIVTGDRFMPPWKADEGKEKFTDAHRLTDAEIALIKKWADSGAPEGNKADLPPAPKFSPGWQLGEPDVIVQPTESYTLGAEGDDVYKCFVIPTNYAEDRYIASMEVRPGNRPVVHHAIAYLDTSGGARKLDEAEAGPGYTSFGGIGVAPSGALGGWAPGIMPRMAAEGSGILLPKGADIVLQVHYHRSGKAEKDLTKLGLYFAKGPVDKQIRTMILPNRELRIPAGEANYKIGATRRVQQDITVLSVTPHMHLLGKEMDVNATLPDGGSKKLVRVNDYDFNWQTIYSLKNPMQLPAGSKLEMTARYDNSADNPTNPVNPPREVTWGEQTTDEMCIAFLNYTIDSEHLTKGEPGVAGGGAGLMRRALEMFDKNANGKLDPDELAAALEYRAKRGGGL